jgi:hypothetical protein
MESVDQHFPNRAEAASRRRASQQVGVITACVIAGILSGCTRAPVPRLFPVKHGENTDYIDSLGKVGFSVKGDGGRFSEGFAPVNVWKKCCTDPLWGYVDESGKFVVLPQFDDAAEFSEGVAAVILGERVGYIDHGGKLAIPYTNASICGASYPKGEDLVSERGPQGRTPGSLFSFHDGLAAACLAADKLFFIDRTGKVAVGGPFAAAAPFSDGMAVVLDKLPTKPSETECFYIDKKGNRLPSHFSLCGQFSEGMAPVVVGNRWGYVDHSGKLVIPAQYFRATYFSEGLAPVAIAQDKVLKWGFIDHAGKFVISAQYDTVGHFSEGLAVVGVSRMWNGLQCETNLGYVDKTGKPAVTPQFNSFAGEFHGGVAQVQKSYVKSDSTGCSRQPSSGGWIATSGKYISQQIWLDDAGRYVPQQ